MAAKALDEIDIRLLALLEQNARRPVVALARSVGLSRSAVQDRLARLEDQGHIAQYTIIRGQPSAAPGMSALLFVTISTRPCEGVLRRIRDWPEIMFCWSVASPVVDAVLLVSGNDAAEIGDLREKLASVPGVADVTTAPVLRSVVARRF